jgi:2-(1,2-epoxy-1,2-dihydrophenyl)acetyl-CoA isomerase
MSYQNILFDVQDGVARLTLNRPDKLNSFTTVMHAELRDALAAVKADKTIRVLVITGAGRAFAPARIWPTRPWRWVRCMPDIGNVVEQNYKPLVLACKTCACPRWRKSTASPPAPAPAWRWPVIW